ncbi:ACT domain-containing protein [Streptacidiphilus rugosus]|uniref:ACT domain-containing protein n=1 Tax=Streptacidiphilus rugosus TaxID=405783 RepID=UPI000A03BC42|nr:ACT domain-containing protein [Streptacidiphilus rugosus]
MTSQLLGVLPGRFVVVERQPVEPQSLEGQSVEGRSVDEQRGGIGDGADDWLALVRAPEGRLTVIRAERSHDPAGLERWRALYGGDTAHGLDVPGMLAALLNPLAAAAVPVFVASTYAADLVLVPAARLGEATAALRAAGHRLTQEESP